MRLGTERKCLFFPPFFFFLFIVQTALLCMVVTEVAFFLDFDTVTTALHCVFCTFVPIYPLIGCLICFIKVRARRKCSQSTCKWLSKVQCGMCSLWWVISYLSMFFYHYQVSWTGKQKRGEYYDPWDRLLVAVIAVSMIICHISHRELQTPTETPLLFGLLY